MAKQKKTEDKEQAVGASPEEILGGYMEEHPEEHLNFVKEVYYQVSTGSLLWDMKINGGLPPGLHRLIGPPESGKSSAALEICRNFFEVHGNGRGLYIKAEGKLPKEMRERCGMKFVWDYKEWKDGTIFVLESNHYEFIINLLRRLVIVPETTNYYCVIFDSMDGLILGGDVKKDAGEGHKVAGAPLLSKQFLQKMGNEMSRRGHMVLMLSQYSTNIQLNQYAAADTKRNKQGGGGLGIAHWAHYVFELNETWNGDLIKEHEKKPPGPDNKILGKNVTVTIKKSPNEGTGDSFEYPIQYGVVGHSSVWTSREILATMKMFCLAAPSGTWIKFKEPILKEVKENTGIDMPMQLQGENQFFKFMEANADVVRFLANRFRTMVAAHVIIVPSVSKETLTDESQESEL